MRLLLIGGTVFVGRHIVECALDHGHEVTIFHRGKTKIPDHWKVQEILGDRDGGLLALDGKSWDAVIDCVGYGPRLVHGSAEKLNDSVKTYLFVSTMSVYTPDESGGVEIVRSPKPLKTEEVNADTYGPLKVECEDAVDQFFKGRSIHLRPGIVAGAYDPTNRFTYWADRFGRFDEVLAPDLKGCPVRLIDARDLGEFAVHLLESNQMGSFDAIGERISFGEMVQACEKVGKGHPAWADFDFLEEKGLKLGTDFPLLRKRDTWDIPARGYESASGLAAGLKRRPIVETAKYTMDWALRLPEGGTAGSGLSGKVGLPREKEVEVLASLTSTA